MYLMIIIAAPLRLKLCISLGYITYPYSSLPIGTKRLRQNSYGGQIYKEDVKNSYRPHGLRMLFQGRRAKRDSNSR